MFLKFARNLIKKGQDKLEEIWRKKRQETKFRVMVKMLEGLILADLDMDMMENEAPVSAMILSEPGDSMASPVISTNAK